MHKFSKTMKIIRSILLLAVGFGTLPAQAQLTIDACQQKAQANYPLVAQYGLIWKTPTKATCLSCHCRPKPLTRPT